MGAPVIEQQRREGAKPQPQQKERGQPCPRQGIVAAETRGQGCPRSWKIFASCGDAERKRCDQNQQGVVTYALSFTLSPNER